MMEQQEQKWIAAAQTGDQSAFEQLVRLYENREDDTNNAEQRYNSRNSSQ